jgi:tRNA nucleotidyltransferase/poly(A) polymerase
LKNKTEFNKAKNICRKLQENNHQALFAGGCVRDMILGLQPKDYDIATSATPDEVKAIFNNANFVGKDFGVSLVEGLEVATFRKESDYKNLRPTKVDFSTSKKEDCCRRDLTINSMLYDPISKERFDYFDGAGDCKRETIKFVGSASERIKEDPTRILRAVRFSTTLGFCLDEEAQKAIVENKSLIADIPMERINKELTKTLSCKNAVYGFMLMDYLGLWGYIIPEINALKKCEQGIKWHLEGNVFNHTFLVLKSIKSDDWRVNLAAILHDIGKPISKEKYNSAVQHEKHSAEMAEDICKRLKITNKDTKKIVWLVNNHMRIKYFTKMKYSKKAKLMSSSHFEDLIELGKADVEGSVRVSNPNENDFVEIEIEYKKFLEKGALPKPLIDGKSLIEFGYKPGPEFKTLLSQLYDLQLNKNIVDKNELLSTLN